MNIFVNSATGDVLRVSDGGLAGVSALLALGYKPSVDTEGVLSDDPVMGGEPVEVGAPDAGGVSPIVEVLPVPNVGASRAQWAAYAQSLGMDVDGLKRDEIRARVSAAAEG